MMGFRQRYPKYGEYVVERESDMKKEEMIEAAEEFSKRRIAAETKRQTFAELAGECFRQTEEIKKELQEVVGPLGESDSVCEAPNCDLDYVEVLLRGVEAQLTSISFGMSTLKARLR